MAKPLKFCDPDYRRDVKHGWTVMAKFKNGLCALSVENVQKVNGLPFFQTRELARAWARKATAFAWPPMVIVRARVTFEVTE